MHYISQLWEILLPINLVVLAEGTGPESNTLTVMAAVIMQANILSHLSKCFVSLPTNIIQFPRNIHRSHRAEVFAFIIENACVSLFSYWLLGLQV
jgi:hypothetical protein